ncbi:hypothetical protein Q3G72_012186 [Acer saccharum]|nr:hypothetical protein Q3G72_012186 [Acer saccharum]
MRGLCFLFCVVIISLFFDRILASSFQADDDHQQTNNTTHFALFVFGDSLYDPGNNNFLNISIVYKANFPPYGETFFGFPTGRASDGRLIPDFVSLHANLPLWKPFLEPGQHEFINGANFASAAATVLPENNPLTLNLDIQQGLFKEAASLLNQQLGDVEAKKLIRNAVYLSSIGGVDYMVFDSDNATLSMKQDYVNIIIGNITNWVKADYDHQQTNNTTHFALFVFGDSLYDPGNNNFLNISIVYKANFPPYGETFFGFPTGRASDGRLIPDFVSLHANLPLWKPFLEPGQHEFINGANFASAAATVLPENNPLTLNLDIQQGLFKEAASLLNQQLGDVEAKKLIRNAVYLSSIGGVDYMVFDSDNATLSMKQDYADDDHQQTNNTTNFALFVFGDSLYDPGNNNFLNVSNGYKANFPPYGETFFGFPTGRFSDGRLIPDFISLHANLTLWKPFLEPVQHEFINGANFASAAATVLPENNPLTGKFFVCTLILYLKFSWLVKRAKLIRIHQYQFGGSD